MAVLVAEDGQVENRVLNVPAGLPTSSLVEAANFLNSRIRGKTLADLRAEIEGAVVEGQAELDQLHCRRSMPRASPAGRAVTPKNASSIVRGHVPIFWTTCMRSKIWSACARCSVRWKPNVV